MKNLFNKTIAENKVPEDWDVGVIVNCFKNKSNTTEQGNYTGVTLWEHMMKAFEKVIKQKTWEVVEKGAM